MMLFFIAFGLQAQIVDSKKKCRNDDHKLRETWRHIGFHAISDVSEGNAVAFLDGPSLGLAATYMKHDRKGFFDGGFDIGFQPIQGLDTTVIDDQGNEIGELQIRNQLIHAHYLLRKTFLQNTGFQPFAEGFGGVRGSFLGTKLVGTGQDDGTQVNDVPFFSANLNFGYAFGLRVQLGRRAFLTTRYSKMLAVGDINVIEIVDPSGIQIDNSGSVSSTQTLDYVLPPHSWRVGVAFDF